MRNKRPPPASSKRVPAKREKVKAFDVYRRFFQIPSQQHLRNAPETPIRKKHTDDSTQEDQYSVPPHWIPVSPPDSPPYRSSDGRRPTVIQIERTRRRPPTTKRIRKHSLFLCTSFLYLNYYWWQSSIITYHRPRTVPEISSNNNTRNDKKRGLRNLFFPSFSHHHGKRRRVEETIPNWKDDLETASGRMWSTNENSEWSKIIATPLIDDSSTTTTIATDGTVEPPAIKYEIGTASNQDLKKRSGQLSPSAFRLIVNSWTGRPISTNDRLQTAPSGTIDDHVQESKKNTDAITPNPSRRFINALAGIPTSTNSKLKTKEAEEKTAPPVQQIQIQMQEFKTESNPSSFSPARHIIHVWAGLPPPTKNNVIYGMDTAEASSRQSRGSELSSHNQDQNTESSPHLIRSIINRWAGIPVSTGPKTPRYFKSENHRATSTVTKHPEQRNGLAKIPGRLDERDISAAIGSAVGSAVGAAVSLVVGLATGPAAGFAIGVATGSAVGPAVVYSLEHMLHTTL